MKPSVEPNLEFSHPALSFSPKPLNANEGLLHYLSLCRAQDPRYLTEWEYGTTVHFQTQFLPHLDFDAVDVLRQTADVIPILFPS